MREEAADRRDAVLEDRQRRARTRFARAPNVDAPPLGTTIRTDRGITRDGDARHGAEHRRQVLRRQPRGLIRPHGANLGTVHGEQLLARNGRGRHRDLQIGCGDSREQD